MGDLFGGRRNIFRCSRNRFRCTKGHADFDPLTQVYRITTLDLQARDGKEQQLEVCGRKAPAWQDEKMERKLW